MTLVGGCLTAVFAGPSRRAVLTGSRDCREAMFAAFQTISLEKRLSRFFMEEA